jgi:hypothetical protein
MTVMQGLRSVAAVVAGFGFMASTAMVGTILATALFIPGGLTGTGRGSAPASVPALYLAATLATSFLGAVFGGWLAARIGATAPFAHALALAAVTAVLAALSASQAVQVAQPGWYAIVAGTAGVAGVLLGGKLRAAAASPLEPW